MADYPTYDVAGKCPKCGASFAAKVYHSKAQVAGDFDGEHMHRTCNSCGYLVG